PARARDDLVAYLGDIGRLDPEAPVRPFPPLRVENLTGLVRAVSDRSSFPPQMSARDSPPSQVVVQEREQRRGVPLVESARGRAQALDQLGSHKRSVPPLPAPTPEASPSTVSGRC